MKTVAIVLWLAGLAICGAIVAHTTLSTDMSAFLPRVPTPEQQILVDQLHDGAVSRLMIVAIEGAAPEKLAVLSKDFAQRLKQDADFASVANGEAGSFAADQDFLMKNRYLLSPAVTRVGFSASGLRAALSRDVMLLSTEMAPMVEPMLNADPTGEMITLLGGFADAPHPALRHGVWFSKDSKRALLLLQTRAPGFDIDAQQKNLQAIDRAFAATTDATKITEAHLLQTGPGVIAVGSRDSIKRDATRFSIIATLLVAAILLTAYRSPRVLILALLPVASGALAGMAAVATGFGYVHGVTLGFGVTLIGEAVDYAIYLFTQSEPGTSPAATLPRIWPTLRLGMLTSVSGFAAMLASSFTGFAQLGLFTIVGLAVALCVTRYVLPALLPANFATRGSGMPALSNLVSRMKQLKPLLALAAVTAIVVLCLHRGGFWEDQISSMSPLTPAQRALDSQLRQDIAAPDLRYLLAVTMPTQERALAASEVIATKLRLAVETGKLDGFDAPTRYVPGETAQEIRQASLPDGEALQTNLTEALQGLPFKPDGFAPFIKDVAQAKTQKLITRASLDGTTLALKFDSLLIARKDSFVALLPLHGVHDAAQMTKIANSTGSVLVDTKAQGNDLLRSYRNEALMLAGAGAIGIVVLLAFSLRSPRRVAVVLAPLALAVLSTAAIVTFDDHKLTIFALFGLLLTVAIGSNYCLFFESERRQPAHQGRTAASLLLANLCTVIAFGILSFSGIPVLSGIGGTVAIGAFSSLIFAAILI